jgi:hypothetical protein
VVTRQLTLKASDRKPPELGPKVRVETAHLTPAGDDARLAVLFNGAGLSDWDKDGFLEQDTNAKNMWRGNCSPELALEFELSELAALGVMEVWNYNGDGQTQDGIRKADVAVSADGTSWQTVLRGAEFAEAEGNRDYDEPIRLKLDGVKARKVRFEHIVPWGSSGRVGLSKVVFHQPIGAQAAASQREVNAASVAAGKQ